MQLDDGDSSGQTRDWLLADILCHTRYHANYGHEAVQGPTVALPLHSRYTLQTASLVIDSTLPQRIQFPVGSLHDENLWLAAGLVAPKLVLLLSMKIPAISHLVAGQAGARPVEEASILRGPEEQLPYSVCRA